VVVAPASAGPAENTQPETMMTMGPQSSGPDDTAPLSPSAINDPLPAPNLQLSPTVTSPSPSPSWLEDRTHLEAPAPGSTAPYLPPTQSAAPSSSLPSTVSSATQPESPAPWMDAPTQAGSSAEPSYSSARRPRKESMWWLWLVLPLLSYSIFATI